MTDPYTSLVLDVLSAAMTTHRPTSIGEWLLEWDECNTGAYGTNIGPFGDHLDITAHGASSPDGAGIAAIEWRNGEIDNVLCRDLTTQELADLARIFLRAAIDSHHKEEA